MTEQFVKWNSEMNGSPSGIVAPGRVIKLIQAIMHELSKRGGKDNGNIPVPYSTRAEWLGTTDKGAISKTIRQAKKLN